MKRTIFSAGFTLVELLVVITIIAILSALTLRTVSFVQDRSARERASGEMAALTSALERYNAENGEYPSGTNTNTTISGDNQFLYLALSPTNITNKVYFEFTKNLTNSSNCIVDPYGNAYGYQYPGDPNRNGTNFFDLWSTANKASNSSSWIKNW